MIATTADVSMIMPVAGVAVEVGRRSRRSRRRADAGAAEHA